MMDDFRYHFKRVLPFIVTILLILVLPAYIFLKKNGFVFFEKKVKTEELLWDQQDKIHVTDSLKRTENETRVVGEIHRDSIVKSDKDERPIVAENIRDSYFIIAGSFTNHENAKLAARKYRSLGYKTSIISMTDPNGIKTELVSVNNFNNFDEASRYLREFQSKFDLKAWIYTKK